MTNNKCPILRRLVGSDILKNAHMTQLFMCIYLKLSDTTQIIKTIAGPVTVKPGHVLISMSKFADGLGVTRQTISSYIRRYVELDIVTTEDLGRSGTLIKFNGSTCTSETGNNNSELSNICNLRVNNAGNVDAPTASETHGDNDLRMEPTYVEPIIISSSLTSYEVRKEEKNSACARARDEHISPTPGQDARTDGGRKANEDGGIIRGSASAALDPVSADNEQGLNASTLTVSPARLGMAQRLKQERARERESKLDQCRPTLPQVVLTPVTSSPPPPRNRLRDKDVPTKFADDSQEVRLAQQLIDLILSEMPDCASCRNATGKMWARSMHVMLIEDSRDPEEVGAVLDYIALHDRWNIMSIIGPTKFRAQYDRIAIKYRRHRDGLNKKNNATSRVQTAGSTSSATETQREASMQRLARLQAEYAKRVAEQGGGQKRDEIFELCGF